LVSSIDYPKGAFKYKDAYISPGMKPQVNNNTTRNTNKKQILSGHPGKMYENLMSDDVLQSYLNTD
jgi:hypothetical protein